VVHPTRRPGFRLAMRFTAAMGNGMGKTPASSPAGRRLRYSERRRIAEEGNLGDFSYDDVPVSLKNAVIYLVRGSNTWTRPREIARSSPYCVAWRRDQ
jgi:hypothetical protein